MIYSNPSFETEKHTHAFGAMLWWAVSLISMFTVGTGVTAIGLCGASASNLYDVVRTEANLNRPIKNMTIATAKNIINRKYGF